ncbi:MAG: hypothetical protein J6W29_01270 [Neisseriaceae bacterium]|nr:hypothetical protein [Neisseriaceae bacterium]
MKKLTALFLLLSLTACATQSFDQQIGSLNIDQEDYARMVIVRATETGSPIANGMLIASVKSGMASNATVIQQTLPLLDKPNIVIAVAGATDAINLAYTEQIIKQYQGQSSATIYVKADEAKINELKKIAEPKGITIKGRVKQ